MLEASLTFAFLPFLFSRAPYIGLSLPLLRFKFTVMLEYSLWSMASVCPSAPVVCWPEDLEMVVVDIKFAVQGLCRSKLRGDRTIPKCVQFSFGVFTIVWAYF